MRSASSWDGAMRRKSKIEYESTFASRCVATCVNAKASWNKINANSRDGTLFVVTSVDATAKAMQRNVLCSMILQTFRGAGTSVARVRWAARYARASARGSSFASSRDGALCKRDRAGGSGWGGRLAVCGGGLRMRTTDSERGPSWYHFGAIQ